MTTIVNDEPLWTVEELSAFLQVPVKTIYKWRETNVAPPAFEVGRYIRFRRIDVMTWLDGRRSS